MKRLFLTKWKENIFVFFLIHQEKEATRESLSTRVMLLLCALLATILDMGQDNPYQAQASALCIGFGPTFFHKTKI